ALEVGAGLQSSAARVGSGKERYRGRRPIGRPLTVIRPIERTGEQLGPHFFAVARKLILGKRLGTADKFAGDAASRSTVALSMLHCLHLHVLPVFAEGTEDATVVSRVAIVVSPSFPHADRCKVRRPHCRRAPLGASLKREHTLAYA